ncbi:MAG: hypothetical protein LBK50_01955 [Candidatus Nomurabacteria bacterium]|jgi:tRNA (guanine10-N2)-dimethyltransferase|nr:hypothetical protein [Candidatus Nomurabacteria bacterium]
MYLFILGRQPELSLAELGAVFGDVETVSPQVAVVRTEQTPDIDRLGGVRKVGRVISSQPKDVNRFLLDYFQDKPAGKLTIGISQYGKGATADGGRKIGIYLKKQLGRSVRVLPNSGAEISDAAALGNKLGSTPNKVEILIVYTKNGPLIAELTGVQNLNFYTLRDRGRPKRDARNGMLPPKLAQIMINLASAGNSGRDTWLFDPFCGTGVVLQEAILMGMNAVGSDINAKMIDFSGQNLTWAAEKFHLNQQFKLSTADATTQKWTQKPNLVVSETYLGQPYASSPPLEKLNENITTCNLIIEKFLRNLHDQINLETSICIAVPAWYTSGKNWHLPMLKDIEKLGYKRLNKNLIYHRDEQIVGREILVLQKV